MFGVVNNIYQTMKMKTSSYFVKQVMNKSSCHAITYDQYGDPLKTLKRVELAMPKIEEGCVLVKLIAAPINPADINMIQGIYPVKPKSFPAVGGNESVCEVLDFHPSVKSLKVGDWVLPAESGTGTWQTYKSIPEANLIKVTNDIPVECAATLTVNPRTAYRMLKDFENLQPGSYIMQNGANSGVGQAVIQLAKEFRVKTINIIRNRPNVEDLTKLLHGIGADYVLTDDSLKNSDVKDLLKSIPKPRLALNCVGGKASAELLKYLDKRGTMVTYGGMSKQPLMIPAGPLIFNDVTLKGFWVTQWTKENFNSPEKLQMQDHLTDLIKKGKLTAAFHAFSEFKDFQSAVQKSMEPFHTQKQILKYE